MSGASEVVKDRFTALFNPVLSQGSETVKDNCEGAEPVVTCKHCWAITNAERKAVRDYYFDPANGKPAHKHL